MKKRIIVCLFMCILLLTGCGKMGEDGVVKKMGETLNKAKAYHLTGDLEIISNEEKYQYDVDVSYEKEDKYRVSLKNKTNNHEQIILKNTDGVYVLTPSLNKSFKFQSEWPYNNSQAYLLQNILDDIKEDKDRTFKKEKDGYIFTAKANYANNKDLTKQNIYVNSKMNITKVEVLDKEGQVKMTMKVKKIDLKASYKKNYFTLKDNMEVSASAEVKQTSKIEDIVYPMYLPENTKLTSQDRLKKDKGERIILNFTGDSPFTLVEETASVESGDSIIPVSGEPKMINDVVGNVADGSVSWISNNIEYYVTSSKLSETELLDIANSISVLPVSK